MPVTTLTAGIVGLMILVLSWRVIQARGQVSKRDDGEEMLQRRIRGQGNLIEYAPTVLILLGLLEYQQAPAWFLWAVAALFVLGRLFHGYAFSFSTYSPVGRTGGTGMTLTALGLLSIGALIMAFA